MNIALFSDTYNPSKNGVVTALINTSAAFKELGHNVILIVPGHEKNEETIYYQKNIVINKVISVSFSFPDKKQLKKILINHKTDIIHTHTEFSIGRCGIALARELNISHVHTCHTFFSHYRHYFLITGMFPEFMVNFLYRKFISRCLNIIAPSNKMRNYLNSIGYKNNIEVINNSINPNFKNKIYENSVFMMDFINKFNISEDEKIVVFIGRFGKEKNTRDLTKNLITVIKNNPKTRVMLIGNGPDKKYVNKIIKNSQYHDKFILPGFIDHKYISSILKNCHIFVTMSKSEVNPISIIEAICSGLPIIAPRDSAYEGLLINGQNGYFFDDENDFIKKTTSLLRNEKLCKKFSQKSIEISEEFSGNVNIKKTEELYLRAIENRKDNSRPKII